MIPAQARAGRGSRSGSVATAWLVVAAVLAAAHVSSAEDEPAAPAPQDPDAPAARAADDAEVSDPEALEILAAAAQRQGGAELAEDGALRSFRIEFANVKVWRYLRNADGTETTVNDVAAALAVDWLRHAGKPSSLRTFWEIDGKKVWRAVHAVRGVFWLSDGKDVTHLTPGTHDADREEVLLHRRLSEALVDVAVLHKLRADGSVWRRVEDTTYDGDALRRTPPPGATGLTFTIWIDQATHDPRHVRVEPVEKGAPILHYTLTYQDDLPEEIFRVTGAELRFPRQVVVKEEYEGVPRRDVMSMFVKFVTFNQVEPAAFDPKGTLDRR